MNVSQHKITVRGATYTYRLYSGVQGVRGLVVRAPGIATFEAADIRQARAHLKMAYQGK